VDQCFKKLTEIADPASAGFALGRFGLPYRPQADSVPTIAKIVSKARKERTAGT
jgi:hypothetical protein